MRERRPLQHPAETRVGTILAAAAGGRVSVRVDGSTLSLPVLRSYAPTVGDQALVLLQRRKGYVVGALGTAATGDGTPTDRLPPPGDDPTVLQPRNGSSVFKPVFAGSRRNGVWAAGDVWQGDPNGLGLYFGACFYGNGPAGIGGTCRRARVRLTRVNGGVKAAPTLRLLGEKIRPAGAPTTTASTGGPQLAPLNAAPNIRVAPVTVTFDIPLAWGQALLDGTSGGIGINIGTAAPAIRLWPIDLLIDWTRSS